MSFVLRNRNSITVSSNYWYKWPVAKWRYNSAPCYYYYHFHHWLVHRSRRRRLGTIATSIDRNVWGFWRNSPSSKPSSTCHTKGVTVTFRYKGRNYCRRGTVTVILLRFGDCPSDSKRCHKDQLTTTTTTNFTLQIECSCILDQTCKPCKVCNRLNLYPGQSRPITSSAHIKIPGLYRLLEGILRLQGHILLFILIHM